MTGIEIHEVKMSDQPFLIEMMVLSLQSLPTLAHKSGMELEGIARLEAGSWPGDRARAFVVWKDEQRAGALWLHQGGEIGASHYTLGLAVAAQFQRQGVGSHLMQYALDFCREYGGQSLNLKVHPSNEVALRLYRRFGFEAAMLDMKRKLVE